ncbi:MAG: cytochrome c oxidase assembly protein [Deltaproteobacteria bacterium]|nr:cytochrome c oxidase assembly protein [Deltaproteobacteria bacterium]
MTGLAPAGRWARWGAGALLLAASGAALAHGGAVPLRGVYDFSSLPALTPSDAWVVWEFYPSIVGGCAAAMAAWLILAGPLRRRWNLSPEGPTRQETSRFVASLLVVFFSLQGPIHELSDRYLFSGHMVQHLLITLFFPQWFILGIPKWMWKPLVERPWAAAIGRAWTKPAVALIFWTVCLYLWHVPAMYDWALRDHNVHIVEHLMFMVGAVVMWWPAWSPLDEVPRLTPGKRMLYLFLLTVPMKALGAIITMSDFLIYEYYSTQPRVFGLDPMVDQRLGGLIMWLPGGLVFWFVIAVTFFRTYYRQFQAERSGTPVTEVMA